LRTEIARRLSAVGDDARYGLDFAPCNALAFRTAPGPFTDLVADVIEAETGRRPALSTTGGTSDARFIAKACPVVEFGLVGRTMHAVDESVAVADIDRLSAIYGRIIQGFLAA
jgi:succinyl-diaminopimelate desuccinylase